MQSAIAVRQLIKKYEEGASGTLALRGVDLDVHVGELLMLMGPSGSGKTTLLSIMGCILTATSGSVRVGGREVVGMTEKQLPPLRLEHIGFVFQGFNLFPTLTAGENVELMLDLKGVSPAKARKRAQELLTETDMPIATIARRSGFGRQAYLGAVFRTRLGQSPASYRTQSASTSPRSRLG